MSDALTSVREEGYQAFLSGQPPDMNPYDCDKDYLNWCEWAQGYHQAGLDNSTPGD